MQELKETSCFYPLAQGIYFIYDDHVNHKPIFRIETEKWNLKVVNNTPDSVNFFQNDGCLMIDNELKKCDWICYKDDEFYFIEAKDVHGNRGKQRKDAVKKFDATIPYFIELYPNIENMKIFVIMNFRSSKITRASDKAREFYFDEKYNAKYSQTNILEF